MSVDDYYAERVRERFAMPEATSMEYEIRAAFEAGYRAGARVREQQNPRWTQPAMYAECPACGDHGDAAHISACCERLFTTMESDDEP